MWIYKFRFLIALCKCRIFCRSNGQDRCIFNKCLVLSSSSCIRFAIYSFVISTALHLTDQTPSSIFEKPVYIKHVIFFSECFDKDSETVFGTCIVLFKDAYWDVSAEGVYNTFSKHISLRTYNAIWTRYIQYWPLSHPLQLCFFQNFKTAKVKIHFSSSNTRKPAITLLFGTTDYSIRKFMRQSALANKSCTCHLNDQ